MNEGRNHSSWSEYQRLVLGLLETHTNEINNIQTSVSESQQTLVKLDSSISTVKDDLHSMMKIVRDGNGSSLVIRVNYLEQKLAELILEKAEDKRKLETLQHFRRGMWVSIGVAVLSAALAIIVALL